MNILLFKISNAIAVCTDDAIAGKNYVEVVTVILVIQFIFNCFYVYL